MPDAHPVAQHPEPIARNDHQPVVHQSKPVVHKSVVHNRVQIVMIHTSRYAFQGQARLAADAGVSRSTISRLLSGKISPTYRLAQAVTAALAQHLKRPLQPGEVFSPTGEYDECSGCALSGCNGCLPEDAYDSRGNLRPAWKNAHPGDWSRTPAHSVPASSVSAPP